MTCAPSFDATAICRQWNRCQRVRLVDDAADAGQAGGSKDAAFLVIMDNDREVTGLPPGAFVRTQERG